MSNYEKAQAAATIVFKAAYIVHPIKADTFETFCNARKEAENFVSRFDANSIAMEAWDKFASRRKF